MSYLRKIHELMTLGGDEAVARYERIQNYEEMKAKCQEEIEYCKWAIRMLESGQDPDKIQRSVIDRPF